ncbi:cytochrome b/b6 domain-containing protein [Algiphilus aromaticivorans]|uniref:cytochrome b/b6 domain-containing protein n=1 Tax=Algiphilus aromaticivorans TaxID=382454 RepID=UPI000A06157D|nr:cytochrome b/b6 domain-containing protein [Algiphilus aromaticivorans]
MNDLKSYAVWDSWTRWFHWINVLCVFSLMAVGLVILNSSSLGLSDDGKISLKEVHTLIGYIFVLNLFWRFIWAFWGNRYARWRSILPGGKGFKQAVHRYVIAFISGRPEQYLGHNPLGRLSVFVLFILLAIQAITGLVLAGTDLFYPPFGGSIAQWIAAPSVNPDTLVPYAREMYDAAAYERMRSFRKPFITTHEYNFFVLGFVIFLHIAAVILTEVREGGSIISAMFTGKKILSQKPIDENDSDHGES